MRERASVGLGAGPINPVIENGETDRQTERIEEPMKTKISDRNYEIVRDGIMSELTFIQKTFSSLDRGVG